MRLSVPHPQLEVGQGYDIWKVFALVQRTTDMQLREM